MLEQKKDAPGNPPYWVCINCKWAFQALQEANAHKCIGQTDFRPSFKSYTRNIKT